jgi:hypothetical protein
MSAHTGPSLPVVTDTALVVTDTALMERTERKAIR